MEKMVQVISPMQFLVNDVYTMWSSSKKDQSALHLVAVLKHVKDEVDVPVFTQTPTMQV